MRTLLASAANYRYGYHLLNMIGSVRSNSDVFDSIVVYDLGLDGRQRRLLDRARGVEIRSVPPFSPHWAQCFSWKPWAWTHLDADRIVWLDAGVTVLRPLDRALELIDVDGYFLVGQGRQVEEMVPSDYRELYGLTREQVRREQVAAGIVGFARGSTFFERVVRPTYDDVLRGRNLGFSASEIEHLNWGLTEMKEPIVRDCPIFRHDQTLLNIHLVLAMPDAHVQDVREYGGWLSPHDHPRQVIWNHRRACDFRYLARAGFPPPERLRASLLATRMRVDQWERRNRRFFQPRSYVRKVRELLRRRG